MFFSQKAEVTLDTLLCQDNTLLHAARMARAETVIVCSLCTYV